MKLKDKTTVKTLREMIGKKIRTRTSRELVKITEIELTEDDTIFIGYSGKMKRRIPIGRIDELVEATEEELKEEFKSPIRLTEEKRLKKWSGLKWEETDPTAAILRPLPPGNPDLLP